MKFLLKIILLLVITSSKIGTFNTNNLCKITSREEKTGVLKKCPRNFNLTCSDSYCTKNKLTCVSVKNLKYMIKVYNGLILFEKELNRYTKFIRMIPNCTNISKN